MTMQLTTSKATKSLRSSVAAFMLAASSLVVACDTEEPDVLELGEAEAIGPGDPGELGAEAFVLGDPGEGEDEGEALERGGVELGGGERFELEDGPGCEADPEPGDWDLILDMLDPSGPTPLDADASFDDLTTPTSSSCYWSYNVSYGSCSFDENCLLWYGWDNRNAQSVVGEKCEYCDGYYTGICYPVQQAWCGC